MKGMLGPAGSRASPSDEPFKISTNCSAYKKHQKCCHWHLTPKIKEGGHTVFPSLSLCPPGTHPRWPQCIHSAGAARKLREDTFTSGLQGLGDWAGQDKLSWGLGPRACPTAREKPSGFPGCIQSNTNLMKFMFEKGGSGKKILNPQFARLTMDPCFGSMVWVKVEYRLLTVTLVL